MRGTGHAGRAGGERARIAARVRALLDPDGSAPSGSDEVGVPGRPGPRWAPDRRVLAAAGVAVLAAALLTAWWVLSSRPRQLALRSSPAATALSGAASASIAASQTAPTRAGPSPSPASSATRLVVDVAGKVHHPGVYTLAAGARVVDALRAAGGVRAGVSTLALNLAAPLQDGQQVLVGVRAPPGAAAVPGAAAGSQPADTAGASSGTVALNSATLEQLETLPGVGPVLAQHILDWRSQHGGFSSVEQLDEVSGIGPAKFAQLRDRVTL